MPLTDHKLLVVVSSEDDADRLISRLVDGGYAATKVSSTGGFLRRGSATIFSGVDADDVQRVLGMIREECKARTELAPAQAMPLPGVSLPAAPAEVRVGGAIVFVLPVEHFEKT